MLSPPNKKNYFRLFIISGLLGLFLTSQAGLASASGPLWSYDTHNAITGIALSGNGEYVAAGTDNNNIFYFNRSGTLLWTNHSVQEISSISMPVSGQYIGVGGTSLVIFPSNGDSIFNYNNGNPVNDVQFMDDGRYIAVMDLNKMSLFTREGGQVWTYSVKGEKTVRGIEYRASYCSIR